MSTGLFYGTRSITVRKHASAFKKGNYLVHLVYLTVQQHIGGGQDLHFIVIWQAISLRRVPIKSCDQRAVLHSITVFKIRRGAGSRHVKTRK
jgi:hypothetical protein